MDLRFETPSTPRQYEQWAAILEQVSGDVFDVDEIAHFVSSDTESAFLLVLGGDEALGCGVGRPSSIQSSLYAMVRVLPEHRGQGVGARIYEALSEHARTLGANRSGAASARTTPRRATSSATAASARPAASTRSCSTQPRPKPCRTARRNRSRLPRRAARPRAGRLRGRLRGRRRRTKAGRATTSRASLSTAGASSTSRALGRSPTR